MLFAAEAKKKTKQPQKNPQIKFLPVSRKSVTKHQVVVKIRKSFSQLLSFFLCLFFALLLLVFRGFHSFVIFISVVWVLMDFFIIERDQELILL